MNFKTISKVEMDKITKRIDESLEKFIKDGKYKEVLVKMGNLYHYSFNNQMLILSQMPNVITTYGIRKWNHFGRHIKAGEKGIKIFTPIIKKVDSTDIDKENYKLFGYQMNYVFDISQTEGREFEVFKFDENKIIKDKDLIIKSLKSVANHEGFEILYSKEDELKDECYGLCDHKNKIIKIREGLCDLQEISTTVHEIAHALAHSFKRDDFNGLNINEIREIKEVEAESISCIVCTYLGLDTKNFNFSYITGWAKGDISKFRNNLGIISKYSSYIINGIDKECMGGF